MAFFSDLLARRNVIVDLLAIFFGISSWISINGLWVELPLLVDRLPESWNLASYLSIIVQLANVGPITIGLLRWKKSVPVAWVIITLLIIGIISSVLLVVFWSETSFIGGVNHSTALFALVFFLSLVDCTSSVLFLPFMGVFKQSYLNSYLVGEGLSGFLPSIAALAQGVGGNPYCENVTIIENGTEMIETQKVVPEPRFSVEVFFLFLATMMVISLSAFLMLNFWPGATSEHASEHIMVANDDHDQASYSTSEASGIQKGHFGGLLLVLSFVCFASNGAFPSIQTFSCLPYGNAVYHLSVTLHSMANPLMAFYAFFVPCKRPLSILGLTAVGTIFAGFLLATALYSPDMLFGANIGGALTVLSWVVFGGLFSYVKISIAGICREMSNTALFWCGAVTQIGSAFGALLMFILVNQVDGVFTSYHVVC